MVLYTSTQTNKLANKINELKYKKAYPCMSLHINMLCKERERGGSHSNVAVNGHRLIMQMILDEIYSMIPKKSMRENLWKKVIYQQPFQFTPKSPSLELTSEVIMLNAGRREKVKWLSSWACDASQRFSSTWPLNASNIILSLFPFPYKEKAKSKIIMNSLYIWFGQKSLPILYQSNKSQIQSNH